MKNIKLPLLALAISTATVACVKQVWQVNFAYNDNDYTYSEDVVNGKDGSLYIAGTTSLDDQTPANDGLFVSKFSASGRLLWKHLIPNRSANMSALASGSVIAVNSRNHAFVAWGDIASGGVPAALHLYEFGARGELLADRIVLSNSPYAMADDIKIGADDTVYLSMVGGTHLQAYSASGALLWQIAPPPAPAIPPGTLPLFPETTPAVTNPFAPGGAIVPLGNGRIAAGSSAELKMIDAGGNLIANAKASDLGYSRFSMPQTVDGKIVVLGITDSQVSLLEFDDTLNLTQSHYVTDFKGFADLAATDNGVCVVSAPFYLLNQAGSYSVSVMGTMGNLVSQTDVPVAMTQNWQMQDIVGGASACAIGEVQRDMNGVVTSTVTTYGSDGKPGEAIRQQDFVVYDLLTTAKNLVWLGITGEYDGSFTEVQLSSH